MEAGVDAELLKTCWAPLGFKLINRHFAAKFHVKAEQLHTVLTDYERMYYERADFMKKFSSLNAKLGGPKKTLLEKIRNMFVSSATKVSNENRDDDSLEFDLEIIAGKRTLKWHFFGQLLSGSENYIFSHVTRPLLNILSVVIDECDLSSINVTGSSGSVLWQRSSSGLFGKPAVQKLYETIAAESVSAGTEDSFHSDDGSDESSNSGIVHDSHADRNSDISLPATPPSAWNSEGTSGIDQEKKPARTQTSPKSSLKKPRLKF
uniref:XLF-like N-terminal domain-containing protein n=1 Tax=Setaria digitata TaxID=48799 RepID=A0A915PLQ1_9BILA